MRNAPEFEDALPNPRTGNDAIATALILGNNPSASFPRSLSLFATSLVGLVLLLVWENKGRGSRILKLDLFLRQSCSI